MNYPAKNDNKAHPQLGPLSFFMAATFLGSRSPEPSQLEQETRVGFARLGPLVRLPAPYSDKPRNLQIPF